MAMRSKALKLNDVVQAFRSDCVRLIGNFEQLETVRFEGFCDIWQEMKFSLIFSGRKTHAELLEFCEDTLRVAKEFFLPPYTFKERIGGLYLLYGLYFKIPLPGPKIRVKMTEWQDIIEFRSEIVQAEHHDASYILAKLMAENAFSHCLFERELGLEEGYRLKSANTINPYSVLPDIKELAGSGDLFERINELSKLYETSKTLESKEESGATGSSSKLSSDLTWYDSRFGEKLLESVKQLEQSRKSNKVPTAHRPIRANETTKFSFPPRKKNRDQNDRSAPDLVRNRQGHGFDTDSSESEDDECFEPLDNDKTLPDLYDSSSFSDD